MVQDIRIPLEWANTIPGVVGVEDVVFEVPTLADIEDAIDELTVDLPDIEALLDGFVDDVTDAIDTATVDVDAIVDAIIDELEARIEDIILDVDDVADAVVDALSLEDIVSDQVNISGIFGPLTEDVVRAFEDILNEVLGAIDDLPEDFDSAIQAINQVLEDTEQLLARFPTDFQETVEDGVDAVLEATGLDEFLEDPVQWLVDAIGATLDQRTSDETKQAVADLRSDIGP